LMSQIIYSGQCSSETKGWWWCLVHERPILMAATRAQISSLKSNEEKLKKAHWWWWCISRFVRDYWGELRKQKQEQDSLQPISGILDSRSIGLLNIWSYSSKNQSLVCE
jgi:hypothetical protein